MLRYFHFVSFISYFFVAKSKNNNIKLMQNEIKEKCKMQYRGGLELLVEAGDQRRIIKLPGDMQGKVAGAKFVDRNIIIKLR